MRIGQNIHDTIPTRDVHRRFLETPGDAYAVMQLKGSAPAELRYTGLKYLSQPPSPGNYDILYTGPIACAQNQSATLEKGLVRLGEYGIVICCYPAGACASRPPTA